MLAFADIDTDEDVVDGVMLQTGRSLSMKT
jgi:hypothetical protein